jgi:hypothetical protein
MSDWERTKFSLVIGGPFYKIQQKLGLLGPDCLPKWTTGLLFAALCWVPLAILAWMAGNAVNPELQAGAFLLDFSVYARFIVAVFILTLMESIADRRIGMLVDQFFDGELVAEEDRHQFMAALIKADQRTSSTKLEICLVLLAYVASLYGAHTYIHVVGNSWFGSLNSGVITLTGAGIWALAISLPFVWFLQLRWFYRFVVWTLLLKDITRLKLRLVPTHPDRCGGLGFLELFPSTFALLVFALSTITASVTLQDVIFSGIALERVGAVFVAWEIILILIFVGPLIVFSPVLYQLKIKGLLEYGNLSTFQNRAYEARWVQGSERDSEVDAPDIASLPDLAGGYESVRSMRTLPVSKESYLPLLIASGLPWLAVVMTQIPFVELLSTVAQALL